MTKRRAEWRCFVWYQSTKPATQVRAASMVSKGFPGKIAEYFTVRNRASEQGLSSLTRSMASSDPDANVHILCVEVCATLQVARADPLRQG